MLSGFSRRRIDTTVITASTTMMIMTGIPIPIPTASPLSNETNT